MEQIDPIHHIRKNVLKVSQATLASLVGVTQATVSRWENGELEPGRGELRRIRDAVAEKGVSWNDRWFFEVPEAAE